MKTQIKKFLNLFKRFKNTFKNRNFPEAIYTKNNNNGLKVHIGTGEINLQGWINIDARNFSHVHIVSDDMKLAEFSDDSIDEIYLCHILEHISFEEANKFVSTVCNKLKKGGVLRIAVPSFDSIVKILFNQLNDATVPGGQSEANPHRYYRYWAHRSER
jgi:predicted SAM-dependent methyltransferase